MCAQMRIKRCSMLFNQSVSVCPYLHLCNQVCVLCLQRRHCGLHLADMSHTLYTHNKSIYITDLEAIQNTFERCRHNKQTKECFKGKRNKNRFVIGDEQSDLPPVASPRTAAVCASCVSAAAPAVVAAVSVCRVDRVSVPPVSRAASTAPAASADAAPTFAIQTYKQTYIHTDRREKSKQQ